jgi:hypothetical protein
VLVAVAVRTGPRARAACCCRDQRSHVRGRVTPTGDAAPSFAPRPRPRGQVRRPLVHQVLAARPRLADQIAPPTGWDAPAAPRQPHPPVRAPRAPGHHASLATPPHPVKAQGGRMFSETLSAPHRQPPRRPWAKLVQCP